MPMIHILRHAQSTFNASKGAVDEYDAPITDLGRAQAETVCGHFDLVIISPMRRCHQTLDTSQITYDEKIVVEDAREMKSHFCDFKEGEIVVRETPEEMFARGQRLKKELIAHANTGKKVLLVAHNKTVFYMTSSWVQNEAQNGVKPKNAELFEYELNE